jgi:hypothetical protein
VSGAPNSQYSSTAKKMKFNDETMTQNRLIWSPDGSSCASANVPCTTPLAMASRSTMRSSPGS